MYCRLYLLEKNRNNKENKIPSLFEKFSLKLQNEIIIEINKHKPPIGNAEAENIPIRNKAFPIFKKLLYSNLRFNVFIIHKIYYKIY